MTDSFSDGSEELEKTQKTGKTRKPLVNERGSKTKKHQKKFQRNKKRRPARKE